MAKTEIDIPLHTRAWRDAKSVYGTYPFKIPVGLLVLVAAVAGAVLPEGSSIPLKGLLAVASAGGIGFISGLVVLLVMLTLAPGRQWRQHIDDRFDELEASIVGLQHASGSLSVPQQTHVETGDNTTINMSAPGPTPQQDAQPLSDQGAPADPGAEGDSPPETPPPAGGTL